MYVRANIFRASAIYTLFVRTFETVGMRAILWFLHTTPYLMNKK